MLSNNMDTFQCSTIKSANENIVTNIKEGVYDISNEEYHASKGISRSGIMEFNKTPFHFWNKYLNPNSLIEEETSSSIKIGSLLHYYILEENKFLNDYIVIDKIDRRTKQGKDYYEQIALSNKKIITQDEFNHIKLMKDSIKSNHQIAELISEGKYEKSIYWNDPDTKLLCKCRPDIWQHSFIVDIKTSSNASYRDFQRSIFSYGYHIQCAMIHEAFKQVFDMDMKDFVFVVVENKAPFATAIYKLDELSLYQSIEIFKNKLIEIKQCFDKNEWPSYKTQIISLPTYAIGE